MLAGRQRCRIGQDRTTRSRPARVAAIRCSDDNRVHSSPNSSPPQGFIWTCFVVASALPVWSVITESPTTEQTHGMKRLRILVMGVNFPPEATGIAPYSAGLAEHWAAAGHVMTVATAFPHYPEWRWLDGTRHLVSKEHSPEGLAIRRARHVLPPLGHGAGGRIVYDTSFAVVSLVNSSLLPAQDLVVTVSPPVQATISGAVLARIWSSRHLNIVQDLPVEAGMAVGMLRSGRMIRAGRALERFAYRLPDRLVVLSDRFHSYVLGLGVDEARVRVIPNWAQLDEYGPTPRDPSSRQRLGAADGEFLLLHTGNMGEKQGLSQLVASLTNSDWFRLALVGDGSQRLVIEAAAESAGFRSLTFLPLQPRGVFLQLLAASDAALLCQRAGVVNSVVPSKLLAYMAAGRPVIAAVSENSIAADIVRRSGCGIRVPPADGRSVMQASARLRRNPGLGKELGAAGREFVQRHFDRRAVLAKYDEVLAELTSRTVRLSVRDH